MHSAPPVLSNLIGSLAQDIYCVRGLRTQPIICVECSVHYWVSCAIYKGGFFRDCMFVVVVDTHLSCFEALAYILFHFDELTHVLRSSFKGLLRTDILSP